MSLGTRLMEEWVPLFRGFDCLCMCLCVCLCVCVCVCACACLHAVQCQLLSIQNAAGCNVMLIQCVILP